MALPERKLWNVTMKSTLRYPVYARTEYEAQQLALAYADDDYPNITEHVEEHPEAEEAL